MTLKEEIERLRALPAEVLRGNILGSPNSGRLEIGRILHLKSEIPKSQIGRPSLNGPQSNLNSRAFGFEMQDSSDFRISLSCLGEPNTLLLFYARDREGQT
jgi:hypothetical protein